VSIDDACLRRGALLPHTARRASEREYVRSPWARLERLLFAKENLVADCGTWIRTMIDGWFCRRQYHMCARGAEVGIIDATS